MATPTPAEMLASIDDRINSIVTGVTSGTAKDIAELRALREVYQTLVFQEPYESADEIAIEYDEFGRDRSDTGAYPR